MRIPRPYLPFHPDRDAYLLEKRVVPEPPYDPETLPIPPPELFLGPKTPQQYISWGRHHVRSLRRIVGDAGFTYQVGSRILDFGCGSACLVRHFADVVERSEIYGVDISAPHINWCRRFLSPPFHFFTSAAFAHLPFEDRYFDLVYAGSVFTHIDDLADAWFMELWRILKPGALCYVTVCDRHTLDLWSDELRDSWEASHFPSYPDWDAFVASEYSRFVLQRFEESYVFHDTDELCASLSRHFEPVSVTHEAYGYQTAVLLRRRARVTLEADRLPG